MRLLHLVGVQPRDGTSCTYVIGQLRGRRGDCAYGPSFASKVVLARETGIVHEANVFEANVIILHFALRVPSTVNKL